MKRIPLVVAGILETSGTLGALIFEARIVTELLMGSSRSSAESVEGGRVRVTSTRTDQRGTACPVDALGETGFKSRKCWDRLNQNLDTLDYFSDLPDSTHVCGKCAALMPCSFLNPVAKI